jgi:hypothetical protein
MGFIHHITGAAGATGLMAESARPQGSAIFGHPYLPATDLPGQSVSATRIGGHPLCHGDCIAAFDDSQTGRKAADPIPATCFHIVKGQNH